MRLFGLLTKYKEFVGHVATMMSGKAIATAIAVVSVPIVARFFEPSDFGVAAVFMSIVGLTSNVASLRYESALVLPKEEQEALTLMAFAYRLVIAFCVLMFVLIGLLEISNAKWSLLELLGVWKWLLPIGFLLMGALQIQESWLMRKKAFKLLSASLVTGNLASSGSRIGFGWLTGTSVYGLIIGNLFGTFCRFIVQKSASREGLRATFSRIGWPEMRQIAHRYADFPKLNAPAGLVSSIGRRLPVLLFGVMFGPAPAGLYAMANRLAKVPVATVANSMRKVFLQKAARINNRGRSLRKAFLLATGGLAVIGAIPLTCLWLFGQPLAAWLLGDRWLAAGRYLEIIAPWMFMICITAPSNPVFVVLRKQKFWLSLQVALTLLRLAVFGFAYVVTAGPEWTLQAYVLVTIAGNTAMIMIALMLISQHAASSPAPTMSKL